ncbi:MAG: hypothetical protein EOP36_20085, partial [Rubrivivax sp.]
MDVLEQDAPGPQVGDRRPPPRFAWRPGIMIAGAPKRSNGSMKAVLRGLLMAQEHAERKLGQKIRHVKRIEARGRAPLYVARVEGREQDRQDIFNELTAAGGRHRWRISWEQTPLERARKKHRYQAMMERLRRRGRQPGMEVDPADAEQLPTAHLRPPQVMTWNVCNLLGKYTQVRQLVGRGTQDMVGLQETMYTANGAVRPFEHRGYHAFSTPAQGAPGRRGLTTLISRRYTAQELASEPWIQAVSVQGGGLGREWLFFNVYCPAPNGQQLSPAERGKYGVDTARDVIARTIQRLAEDRPLALCVAVGDFNMRPPRLAHWAQANLPAGMSALPPVRDDLFTRQDARSRSCIDHIVVQEAEHVLFSAVDTLTEATGSDHLPLVARCHEIGFRREADQGRALGARQRQGGAGRPDPAAQPQQVRIARIPNPEQLERMARDNRLAAFAENQAADANVRDLWSALVDAARRHCAEPKKGPATTTYASNDTKRLERKARTHQVAANEMAARLEAMQRRQAGQGNAPALEDLRHREREARAKAAQLWTRARTSRKVDAVASLQSRIQRVLANKNKDSAHKRYVIAMELAGARGHRGGAERTPVRDTQGVLQTSVAGCQRVWRDFTRTLYTAAEGAAPLRGVLLPPVVVRVQQGHNLGAIPTGEFTDDEVVTALKRMKNRSAPGVDQLTADLLKGTVAVPGTATFKILKHAANRMWLDDNTPLPPELQTIVLVPLLKKGDRTEPNNYRTIALIPTIVKLTCLLVLRRLEQAVENHGVLYDQQAGFRPGREGLHQVAFLQTLAATAAKRGEPCLWAAFIDFAKAYDRVQHSILFDKLRAYQAPQRLLAFLTRLYSGVQASVRVGDTTTEPVPITCGLRQGCPLSPILFNLFINDLVSCLAPLTVRAKPRSTPETIPHGALLFADDLVILANSTADLQRSLDGLTRWCNSNNMTVNSSKCGVMCWPPGDIEDMHVQAQVLPTCDTYVYLGVDVNNRARLAEMPLRRIAETKAWTERRRYFFKNTRIPITLRALVLRGVVEPMVLYGCEVWGKRQRERARAASVINQAARWIAGHGAPAASALSDLGIPLVTNAIMARRTRFTAKGWHDEACMLSHLRHRDWLQPHDANLPTGAAELAIIAAAFDPYPGRWRWWQAEQTIDAIGLDGSALMAKCWQRPKSSGFAWGMGVVRGTATIAFPWQDMPRTIETLRKLIRDRGMDETYKSLPLGRVERPKWVGAMRGTPSPPPVVVERHVERRRGDPPRHAQLRNVILVPPPPPNTRIRYHVLLPHEPSLHT